MTSHSSGRDTTQSKEPHTLKTYAHIHIGFPRFVNLILLLLVPSFKFSSSNIMVGGRNGSRVRGRGWWRVPRLEKPDVKLKREFLRTKYDGTVTLDWVSGDAKRLPEDMSIPLLLTRILPLKDLGINVTNGDKDQSINDSVFALGSEPHDDSAFGKPHKYLPIKKEVVIDGKKMVAEEANASQGQCDDNADDWLPAMNYLLKNRISNKIRLEEEGVEGNDAENLNEEFEHLDMTSEINESVNASFMDDQSSEHIGFLNSTADGKTYITSEELQKHNKASDLWILIQGKVYDVTEWVKIHPGGDIPLMNLAGQDVTDDLSFSPGPQHVKHLNKHFNGYHFKRITSSKSQGDYMKACL
ncbi:delta(8)-fatty-acid desaturase-like protein [Tanacetum coccineum]|uniref:Delta(8)-fatty-acid desaturase-like protein n=1 Tax=Tanacetum coccineum TaxID=301880 RepID=A0ABQ5D2T4_9ASTR